MARKLTGFCLQSLLGVFESGEARLLFSSAQVEYIRYYLHAMGLVNDLLPLPSSEYLIRKSDLKSCAPEYFSDAPTMKKRIKVRTFTRTSTQSDPRKPKDIDKINKRLKGQGADRLLALRRINFERVRSYWAARAGTWLAVDIEAWEREHALLLEFGWSLVRWDQDGKEVSETKHLVIKERMGYYNSTYVQGNRDVSALSSFIQIVLIIRHISTITSGRANSSRKGSSKNASRLS